MIKPKASIADLQEWARKIMERPRDAYVGDAASPYLNRWYVIPRNDFANIYLHEILKSDTDRALHDHPWDNMSIILSGKYTEHLSDGSTAIRLPESTVKRLAADKHRLELARDEKVISIFITGPVVREWGFHCPQGWVPWERFLDTGGC